MLIAIIITAAIVALIFYFERRKRLEDLQELRHTIEVNHNILKDELVELGAVAITQTGADCEKATGLLKLAGRTSKWIDDKLSTGSKIELQHLLVLTFTAMDLATEARHLLKACKPMVLSA